MGEEGIGCFVGSNWDVLDEEDTREVMRRTLGVLARLKTDEERATAGEMIQPEWTAANEIAYREMMRARRRGGRGSVELPDPPEPTPESRNADKQGFGAF
jgi:hypothetical protein